MFAGLDGGILILDQNLAQKHSFDIGAFPDLEFHVSGLPGHRRRKHNWSPRLRKRFAESLILNDCGLHPALLITAHRNTDALHFEIAGEPGAAALVSHDMDFPEFTFGSQVGNDSHVAVILNALRARTVPLAIG